MMIVIHYIGEKSAPGSRPATSWSETPERLSTAGEIIGELRGGIRLDDYMRRYVCVMASGNIQPAAKAARTVELLVNCFEYHFIYARHLELLCMIFDEYGTVPCSEFFGTYRVELVISLFACVVDIHNFEIVMRRLTPFEAGCVICRLGWLHIYNPMKPEGELLVAMFVVGIYINPTLTCEGVLKTLLTVLYELFCLIPVRCVPAGAVQEGGAHHREDPGAARHRRAWRQPALRRLQVCMCVCMLYCTVCIHCNCYCY